LEEPLKRSRRKGDVEGATVVADDYGHRDGLAVDITTILIVGVAVIAVFAKLSLAITADLSDTLNVTTVPNLASTIVAIFARIEDAVTAVRRGFPLEKLSVLVV
jgi:hypothetical protein